ncbi:MAG: large conductance mechanosensitive channel protein MscL [Actinomycetota bacterium]
MAGKKLATEFKEFVLRGNVVDLAVAVVIGAAFGDVVKALVADLVTPLISIPGKANFQDLIFKVHGSKFMYGDFFNNIITFLSIAIAVFFFVVKPVNVLLSLKAKRQPAPEVTTRECPECMSTIPKKANRCSFCTAVVGPEPEPEPEPQTEPEPEPAADPGEG